MPLTFLWVLAIAYAHGVLDYYSGVVCDIAPVNTNTTLAVRLNSNDDSAYLLAIRHSDLPKYNMTSVRDFYVSFPDDSTLGTIGNWLSTGVGPTDPPFYTIVLHPDQKSMEMDLFYPDPSEGAWCVFAQPFAKLTTVSVNFYSQPGTLNPLENRRYHNAAWSVAVSLIVIWVLKRLRKTEKTEALLSFQEWAYVRCVASETIVCVVSPFLILLALTVGWGFVKNNLVSRLALEAGHEWVVVATIDWLVVKLELIANVWIEVVAFIMIVGYRSTYLATYPIDGFESQCDPLSLQTKMIAKVTFIVLVVGTLCCTLAVNDYTSLFLYGYFGIPKLKYSSLNLFLVWTSLQIVSYCCLLLARIILLACIKIGFWRQAIDLAKHLEPEGFATKLALLCAQIVAFHTSWRCSVDFVYWELISWRSYVAHPQKMYGVTVLFIVIYLLGFMAIKAHKNRLDTPEESSSISLRQLLQIV